MAESRSEETNVGETKAAGNDTETVQNSSSLHSLTEKLQGLDIMIESQTKLKEMQENGTDWLQNITLKKASGKKSEKDHGKESVSAEMSKFVSELQRTDIKETSPEKDKKADSPGKKKQKIGSISSEMQAEFLASYQENLAGYIGSDDIVMRETQSVDMKEIEGARIKQKYSSEAGCVEDRKGEMKDNSAGSVEKKSPKKKKNKKKGPSPEKDYGDQDSSGSYSQLLQSMGKRGQKGPPQSMKYQSQDLLDEKYMDEVDDLIDEKLLQAFPELLQYQGVEQVLLQDPDRSPGKKGKKKNKRKHGRQAEDFVDQAIFREMGSGGARDQSRNLRASPGRQYEMAYQLPKSGSAEQTTGQGKKGKKNRNQPLFPAAQHNEVGQNSVGIKHKKNKNKGAENKPSTNVTITTPASSQESDPDVTSLEVSVPKAEHMFIVGPQRSHIREIREATGVKVIVPPYNSPSDKITLKGDKLQLGPALNLLFLRSQEAQMAFHRGASNQSPRFNESLMQGQGHNSAIGKHPDKTPAPPQGRHLSGENVYVVQDALDTERYKVKGKTPTSQGQVQRSDHKNWRQPGYHGSHQHGGGHHKGKGPHVPVYQEMAGHGHHMSHTPQKGHGGNQGQAQGSAGKGQGQRQRKRQQVFAEYLTREELSAGLKTGTLIEGAIRINPKNYEEAYVPHPDGTSDILISSFKHRNRALNGDVVAVQLLEKGEWKFNKDELASYENDLNKSSIGQNSDDEIVIEAEEIVEISVLNQPSHGGQKAATGSTPASQTSKRESSKGEDSKPDCSKGGKFTPKRRFTTLNDVMLGNSPVKKRLSCDQRNVDVKKMLQRTGKVVAIIERKHSRACTGQIRPMQDKHCGRALFAPNDHRMPRIMIPIENCPKDFLERPDDYARNLFVARVTDWRSDSMMADGCLHKSLGEAGEVEPETEGMLIENGVDYDEFPQQALDCLPQNLPWRIPESEMEEREDFRRQCVFTIDPATARDLDDALSCEDLGNGRYKVGVHIADVSYFVDEETVLDRVAALRSTSVYLVHKVIPMLPRLLCEQLCSLNPDEDRLTFSVQWTITENGEIEDEWFGRSIIRSCVKLAYDHAQGFIEQPERDWGQQELPPLSKGYTVDDIKSRVLNLHKIAVKLRAGRMSSGALRLDQVKLQYSLDRETGLPNGYTVYQQKDSNKLVEEFMLLANMAVAHRINREFPDKALLRRHPPPQEKMLETLRDQCSALGIHIDTSSAGAFQRSLLNYYGEDDFSMARMQVLVALCSKPMQNAKYFCSGSIPDEHMYHHYALNVPLYTHFTSPIRRYPDILVHRLLAASLDYCAESKRSSKEIQKWADHANDKKLAAKRVGDLSSELFFSVFVKTAGPLEEKAMVMGVMDKAFDIFVLRLGVSKRVYCDKLPLKEKIFRREHKVPSLVLVWQAVDGEPEVRQEITIFTVVDCVLATGDLPTTWTAVVKRPEPHNFDAFGLMGGANQQMGGAFEQIEGAHEHNSLEGGVEGGGTGDLAEREVGHNDEELSRATEALSLNAEHGR